MGSAARPNFIIAPPCQALVLTVHQASNDVYSFVRRCHSARTDLAPIMRELSELHMVLQLINGFEAQSRAVPQELQFHLGPIISNCIAVVSKFQEVLRRHEAVEWTAEARNEVGEMAKMLGVHRAVMGLVSDLISNVLLGETRHSDEAHFVSALLKELRALGSSLVISYSNATLAREHFALQVHLGQIITCVETLARTDVWQDAVEALDEAQNQANLDRQQPNARSSSPLPLSRDHSTDKQVVTADIRNDYLETLSRLETRKANDPTRPSNRTPDPKPPATIESAGPSGTGFIVMDGFINSAHGSEITPQIPSYGDQGKRHLSRTFVFPQREAGPSQRSLEYQDSAGRSAAHPGIIISNSLPSSPRASAAGLQLQIPYEKEVVIEEGSRSISDEALAFAQVPIHVLDRLSLNLVGHVYGASPTDQSGFHQPLSTPFHHSRKEQANDTSDGPSNCWSTTDGVHDVNLECSQIDMAIIPPVPTSHPHFQPDSRAQIPLGRHQSLLDSHKPSLQATSDKGPEEISQVPENAPAIANFRPSFTSAHSLPTLPSHQTSATSTARSGLREVDSMSKITMPSYTSDKPLPRAPLVYIPDYPGPFIKGKVVVVGNFSCGKTCLITRMVKGEYPRNKSNQLRIAETVKLSVDEAPIELNLWDISSVEYDPSWLRNAHVALVCFSVNIGSTDHKGKHLGRWVAEVNRNCPGAAILLVGLKADIRFHTKSMEKLARTGKALVTPEQGELFRENIGATRYVECSARTGEGVRELLGETARVAMQVQRDGRARKASTRGLSRPLSRIGKFFGLSGQD